MAPFSDVAQVEATLEGLRTREDGPFLVRLPREPGQRDSRYAQLFSGPVLVPEPAPAVDIAVPSGIAAESGSRLDRLEEQLRQLREELEELKKRVPQ